MALRGAGCGACLQLAIRLVSQRRAGVGAVPALANGAVARLVAPGSQASVAAAAGARSGACCVHRHGIPMRALVCHAYGPIENLKIADLPIPEPKAGEILVRVGAAGVSFAA